jgi:hypothetical protein
MMTVERVLLNQAMIALLIMVSNVSSAYFSPLDDIRDSVSDQIKDYYVIEESKIISDESNGQFQDPYSMLTLQDQQPAASAVDLLNWKYVSRSFSQPEEHYNRKKHFGGWVSDPNDNSCFNTRAQILERDSQTPVQTSLTNRCLVAKGTWEDPYTGEIITEASDIQIDHVVPLKQAYITGGFGWNKQKRCLYGNFTKTKYHLLSVKGHENMKKSDKTPAEYLPPNATYVCEYIHNWLKIKLAWRLVLGSEEGQAINKILKEYDCNPRQIKISERELATVRAAEESSGICGDSDQN